MKDPEQYYFKKMEMFTDNAKSYIQIAAASLVLPITFLRQLTGNESGQIHVDFFLIFSWAAFLVCIGGGLLYQYLAVKVIEVVNEAINKNWLIRHIRFIFGLMQITFYLGAISFVLFAINQILI